MVMRIAAMAVVPAVCLLSLLGCGSSSSGDDSNGDGSGIDWSTVNPPPNIDISSCFHLTYENDPKLEACSACCETAGFSSASSLNDDHCTCGTNPPDDRDTVCAAMASETSFEPCSTCCETAGYNGSVWLGGTAPSCSCHGRTDRVVCAASLAHESPDEACFYCCLDSGFLSAFYAGIGDRECGCITP